MLRSVRLSAAKMKGLYTSWVSWNTLPGSRGASLSLSMPTQRLNWESQPSAVPTLPRLTSSFRSSQLPPAVTPKT